MKSMRMPLAILGVFFLIGFGALYFLWALKNDETYFPDQLRKNKLIRLKMFSIKSRYAIIPLRRVSKGNIGGTSWEQLKRV